MNAIGILVGIALYILVAFSIIVIFTILILPACRVAHVVEFLPSKLEALISNSSADKWKKKKHINDSANPCGWENFSIF
jgi:hypothetical protein